MSFGCSKSVVTPNSLRSLSRSGRFGSAPPTIRTPGTLANSGRSFHAWSWMRPATRSRKVFIGRPFYRRTPERERLWYRWGKPRRKDHSRTREAAHRPNPRARGGRPSGALPSPRPRRLGGIPGALPRRTGAVGPVDPPSGRRGGARRRRRGRRRIRAPGGGEGEPRRAPLLLGPELACGIPVGDHREDRPQPPPGRAAQGLAP